MLLPTKYLSPDRCILGVGSHILALLTQDATTGELWTRYRVAAKSGHARDVSYDWFLLGLAFLYATDQIQLDGKVLFRGSTR